MGAPGNQRRIVSNPKRARERMERVGRSPLDELARQDREGARNLLHDIERLQTSLERCMNGAQEIRRYDPAPLMPPLGPGIWKQEIERFHRSSGQ